MRGTRQVPVDEQADKRRAAAQKLLEDAQKAAADAEAAERRVQEIKSGSTLSDLAAVAKKYKMEQEKAKLVEVAKKDRMEAEKLEKDADEAEKERGTTTVRIIPKYPEMPKPSVRIPKHAAKTPNIEALNIFSPTPIPRYRRWR